MCTFSDIYLALYPRLLRFAENFIQCRPDAENVLQDAFIDLWKINNRIHEIENVQFYMFRLIRNRCMDYLRHKIREKTYKASLCAEMEVAVHTLVHMDYDDVQLRELNNVMENAINNLPERCREIFLLSRRDGLKYHEIASHLGISENTVSAQMGIAIKRLRTAMADYEK